MFSRDSKSTTPVSSSGAGMTENSMSSSTDYQRSAPSRNAAPSIISPDLKIKGDLHCAGDIQVDGHVEGDISSRSITIGEAAQIHGAISAESIRICGSVNGQVKGATVTLAKTARVTGDVLHQTLSIEPGAFFEGQCRRIDASQSGANVASIVKDKTTTVSTPAAATPSQPTAARA
jgi:cytoskeletal protein CcmA (bactofilin family)